MPKGIIDAIFWKLHASYLKNDRKTADLMLGMIEDEGKRASIKEALGKHFDRYEIIKFNIQNKQYGRIYGQGTDTPEIDPFGNKESDGKEAEFHKKLMSKEGRQKLFNCLGIEFWATMVHELEMDPYGRCDFLIREGRELTVCEVKMGSAKSSVVSQIDKYRLAMELDFCLGLHEKVNAVVIAETFSPYVATELSRLSVQMVQHSGEPESLRKL